MNTEQHDFDESEIHAWIDGQLDPDRARAIETAIDADAELGATVKAWAAQNDEIRALYGGVANEPMPRRICVRSMAARQARRRWLAPVAASVIWLALGLTGGWLAHDRLGGEAVREDSRYVAQQAISAHRVYAVEVVHPVEVFADQQAHLVKWLSKRLDHPINTPDLTPLGFKLVGGRLLPARDGAAAAQFMYEDGTGRRVTIYVSHYRSGKETAFRYQEIAGAGAFVWLDPDMGYAIAGDIPRKPLLAIAEIVYEAFEPTH